MIKDIHPRTAVARLRREFQRKDLATTFSSDVVLPLIGMSASFVTRVLGRKAERLTLEDVLDLLDQDAFSETFIPRSKIPEYLLSGSYEREMEPRLEYSTQHVLLKGNAVELLPRLPAASIPCVVTSTPYWGMRLYEDAFSHTWADGETCAFGNEQTPEGFIRHTIEILHLLKPALTSTASVWWNLMDTYNTRTQIRSNASETLNAMRGNDARGWRDHECRRYSAGHSYMKDGEQCIIPANVAMRASRIGYFVKSTIAWKKNGSMPETVDTRATRELEYILHLSTTRAPLFNKDVFRTLPENLGGRNIKYESEKLTDIWHFSTATGLDGHGAQFPIALPGRCIALTTKPGDRVLDPFLGSGTTSVTAQLLQRLSIGFDISPKYLSIAEKRLRRVDATFTQLSKESVGQPRQATLL